MQSKLPEKQGQSMYLLHNDRDRQGYAYDDTEGGKRSADDNQPPDQQPPQPRTRSLSAFRSHVENGHPVKSIQGGKQQQRPAISFNVQIAQRT